MSEQLVILSSGATTRPKALGLRATFADSSRRDPLLRRMLAVADLLAGIAAFVALGVATGARGASVGLLMLPTWLVLAKLAGLYDRDQRSLRHLTVDELPSILKTGLAASGLWLLLFAAVDMRDFRIERGFVVLVVLTISDLVLRGGMRWLWRRLTPRETTLIVGSGALVDATRKKLQLFDDVHVEVVGARELEDLAELSGPPQWLRSVDRVIVASAIVDESMLAELLRACRAARTKLSVVPPVRGMFGTAVGLNHLGDLPVLEYSTWDVSRSTLMLKRTLDLVVSAVALVLVAPLLLALATAVRFDSAGPIFFRQKRAGKDGEPFLMLKFRTMVSNADEQRDDLFAVDALDEPTVKLENDPRVTRLGKFLRRSSLDELPQLVNVLLGDMSLVGPRPEEATLVHRYWPEHRFRLLVKPGMTGPMQVFGRGWLSFQERLAIERDYVDNLSLGRDLRILAMTLSAVVGGRGAF